MPFVNDHDLGILKGQAKAWEAVFAALIECNPETFRAPVNGLDCAINEIKRMHKLAKRVPGKAITIPVDKAAPKEVDK